ncbi:MAG: hypothetical protein GF317_04630 [Candidatus Lokiarchaeota archaeon]|nr:hypothetical protein [Candidatus Lokiarchaeota archaeon]
MVKFKDLFEDDSGGTGNVGFKQVMICLNCSSMKVKINNNQFYVETICMNCGHFTLVVNGGGRMTVGFYDLSRPDGKGSYYSIDRKVVDENGS